MAGTATQALRDEHQVILAVLECLAALTDQVRQGGEIDSDAFLKSIDFIRGFADKWHHAKEEDLLFPALERKGVPKEGGPIGVMLYEHDVGRRHVQRMEEALRGAAAGDEKARAALIENASGYVELLRGHIGRENNVLFEMADRVLSPDEQTRLVEQYAVREREGVGGGTREHYIGIAGKLCAKCRVDLNAMRESGSAG
jgi:hemerythrin-like domain-containing protein